MPFYVDIHAHLADARIRPRLPDMLAECRRRGVGRILANAARLEEWPEILRLAQADPDLVAGALGLHPFFLDAWTDALPARLTAALRAAPDRLRAVGEIGLDFYPETLSRFPQELQMQAFEAQLRVAAELGRPAILHNRKSWEAFFPVWNRVAAGRIPGVCHHFTGSREIARRALDAGLYLSFCGPLTWPSSRRIRDVAAYVPPDRLLTETDTPDLPAEPYRDGGASEPWHVIAVVDELARLRDVSSAAMADQIAANAARLLA